MSRHHQVQSHRSPSSSGVDVVSSPAAASPAAAASAALRVGYTHPLVVYLKFFPGGIRYTQCTLDGTAEAATEAEAAAASASSDLEKKFRPHFNERGEGDGEGTCFSFFPFSSAAMRRSLLVKDSSVGNFHRTRDI